MDVGNYLLLLLQLEKFLICGPERPGKLSDFEIFLLKRGYQFLEKVLGKNRERALEALIGEKVNAPLFESLKVPQRNDQLSNKLFEEIKESEIKKAKKFFVDLYYSPDFDHISKKRLKDVRALVRRFVEISLVNVHIPNCEVDSFSGHNLGKI